MPEKEQPITLEEVLNSGPTGDKLRRWFAGERVDDAVIHGNHTLRETATEFYFSDMWGTVRARVHPPGGWYLTCKAGSEIEKDRSKALKKIASTIWNLNARGVIM